MNTKLFLLSVLSALLLSGCATTTVKSSPEDFIRIEGQDLIAPDGSKFFIKGTNLGNWLNPEGYMFGFSKTNSARMIDQMFCEMVGPDFTAEFWEMFKDNYVTRADIEFIASTGANTIRLPFHYKLFTDEDYMGRTVAQDGFERVDSVITWCRDNGLYVILDMHDAPEDRLVTILTTATAILGFWKVRSLSSFSVTSGERLPTIIRMSR